MIRIFRKEVTKSIIEPGLLDRVRWFADGVVARVCNRIFFLSGRYRFFAFLYRRFVYGLYWRKFK